MRSSASVGGLLCATLRGTKCRAMRTFSKARTEVLFRVSGTNFSLVLLSLVLPKVSKRRILTRVQGRNGAPIVILATGSKLSRGVKLLADKTSSCVAGPFRVRRILTQVRIRLHRVRRRPRRGDISCGGLRLSHRHFRIQVTKILLPGVAGRRFTVLRLLLRRPGRIFDGRRVFRCT